MLEKGSSKSFQFDLLLGECMWSFCPEELGKLFHTPHLQKNSFVVELHSYISYFVINKLECNTKYAFKQVMFILKYMLKLDNVQSYIYEKLVTYFLYNIIKFYVFICHLLCVYQESSTRMKKQFGVTMYFKFVIILSTYFLLLIYSMSSN